MVVAEDLINLKPMKFYDLLKSRGFFFYMFPVRLDGAKNSLSG